MESFYQLSKFSEGVHDRSCQPTLVVSLKGIPRFIPKTHGDSLNQKVVGYFKAESNHERNMHAVIWPCFQKVCRGETTCLLGFIGVIPSFAENLQENPSRFIRALFRKPFGGLDQFGI